MVVVVLVGVAGAPVRATGTAAPPAVWPSPRLPWFDSRSGNSSVRCAGVTSGVIDVAPRLPTLEDRAGSVHVNLLETGAFAGEVV